MDSAAIDGLLEQAVNTGALPGVVAMVGDREGTLYEGVRGRVSVAGDEPARPDSMFWIASMTKAVVSAAALQLIERGELALEQPVADILPAFGELPILDGFDVDGPRLRTATRPVPCATCSPTPRAVATGSTTPTCVALPPAHRSARSAERQCGDAAGAAFV